MPVPEGISREQMTATTAAPARKTRTLTIGGGTYPLILPNIRDPRLHVASVIISVHVLGQVGLGFWVSVPQILAAILTCWIIEVVITFRQAKAFVWPASAMLTGSGVALILRVVGTANTDPWATDGWQIFAVVAGLSLLSKYVIKYRGSHVFNPSNLGLVVAFLVLGSTRVEPLDFWWAPLNPPMLLAYAAIVGGGLLITRRLKLLVLAASFWLTLAVGLGVLAASGHCIVARWSFGPVCGADYLRVILTSPELMIFLFFMITDPKTVPSGRVGRVVFGVLVAVTSTLLMAPQADEWWTKVALLTGLVAVCAARPIVDRLVPAPGSDGDRLDAFRRRLIAGPVRAGAAAVVVLLFGAGVVFAGGPARTPAPRDTTELLAGVPVNVDPSTLPPITVATNVADFDPTLAGDGIRAVIVTLAQNLEIENAALLRRDADLLTAVDHGDRLAEMQAKRAAASGQTTIVHYRFDSIAVDLLIPFGVQDGFSLGIHGKGTATTEVRDAAGGLVSSQAAPFDNVFAVRRATGARWLNIGLLPPSAPAS
jgi:Na+-translocating ferredoxin:NAD+ oxidoreductase RnfD subunit